MKWWQLISFAWILGCGVAVGDERWTLERALERARLHNPDARLARSRMAAAQAALDQANATFWPRLQLQSSYTRTDNPMLVFGSILNQRAYPHTGLNFNDVPDVDDLNARGVVTMPLYAGGRNRAEQQAANANAEAAKHDEEAVRNALGFEVVRSFYTVLKTREFILATEAAAKSFEANLATAQKRFDRGSLLKTEVLDLEVRLAQAREDLVRARNANALALRSLRNLLGIEQDNFDIVDTGPTPDIPEQSNPSNRPELNAARSREHAAEEQLRAAKSGYLPRVHAFGSLDYDYGWKFENGGHSYSAGAIVQWDIWDGKLTRGKAAEARANLDAQREEHRKVRLALDLEVEQAKLTLQAANERLAVTAQMVALALQSSTFTRARFEQGTALSTQVMDADTALVSARVRRAEAEADQRIAIAALRKALGLPPMDTPSTKQAEPEA